jgi:hypothetical protein
MKKIKEKLFPIFLGVLKYSLLCIFASFFFIAIACLILNVHSEDPLIWNRIIFIIPKFALISSFWVFVVMCVVFVLVFPPTPSSKYWESASNNS